MPRIDSVIFDLDGTLWDASASCAMAWNTVIRRAGIRFREITADDVRRVTGMPHEACIRAAFAGLSEEQVRYLIRETMQEDNVAVAMGGADLYQGVSAGVRALRERYPLFIVSNCQAGYIESFLKYSGLGELFTDFECWGNTGKAKSANLAEVISRNRLESPVFVGDTEGDLIAARACGIPFYFAEYGFGSVEGCDFGFSRFEQLARRLA